MEIGDIDLILTSSCETILCEVKSYGQTNQENGEKIIKRIKTYQKLNDSLPNKFIFFVQSIDLSSAQKIKEQNPRYNPHKWYEKKDANKLKILSSYASIVKNNFPTVEFEAYLIEIPLIKGDLRINYTELLKRKLKEEDFIPLTINIQ